MKSIKRGQLRVLSAVCDISCVNKAVVWEQRSILWAHPDVHPQFLEAGSGLSNTYKRYVAVSLRKLKANGLIELTRTHVRATTLGTDINEKAKSQRDVWHH